MTDEQIEAAARKRPPPLPAHVEGTVQALAEVHLQHHRQASTAQRAVDRLTNIVGRTRFIAALSALFVLWIGTNLLLGATGHQAFDPAPFQWLQDFGTLLALYITVLILITQRRENQLTQHREQLTLQLAMLADQKTGKIIGLLEELRRDHPQIHDRIDVEADEMSRHSDPQVVLEAIKESNEQNAEDDAAPAR